MRPLTLGDLRPFQIQAAGDVASMVQEYPSERFKPRYDQDTGDLMPFLCRLRAITGSGKTPMLALASTYLRDGVILWTTNRGAVISQTLENLRPGGTYADLLPEGTQVFAISEMADMDWVELGKRDNGLTILLATVAAFNQDSDALRIHRDRGDGTTAWDQLAGRTDAGRRRPLYVFYDEGHGATERQFRKLKELQPRAFVLASASPLPDDLNDLIPGRSHEEQEKALRARTVAVSTKDVVNAGLLKSRLYFTDCKTAQADAIKEADEKWRQIARKLGPKGLVPIACFIVNDTARGVDVWEQLVKLGVSKTKIAVHLDHARDVMIDRRGVLNGLIDTYSGKRPDQRSPSVLRSEGYTHIIWNLTLREGWDEPLAYVGYIDDKGRSSIDIVQKIGRFVRQVNASPFFDADLNSAYFYFNVSDSDFEKLLSQTQQEMETDGYEIIGFVAGTSAPPSRLVAPKEKVSIQTISCWFGEDIEKLDAVLLSAVPGYSDEALRAPGSMKTRVIDLVKGEEDKSRAKTQVRDSNESITPWDFLTARLAAVDSRIVTDTGTRFSASLREHAKMRQRMQFGSEAMHDLQRKIDPIVKELSERFRLVAVRRRGTMEIQPFNLVAPDAQGSNDKVRERYKVRRFRNSVHPEYNGMNPFEVEVAEALDRLGKRWCRNPANKSGFRIPIPELGADTEWFYPDFLVWVKDHVWIIDPKGTHLVNDSITGKLLDLQSVDGLQAKMRVAFLVEGRGVINENSQWRRESGGGYTMVRRVSSSIKAIHFTSTDDMVKELLNL